jgi:hypothetical protein
MPHNCMPCTVYCLSVPYNCIFRKAYICCISQISILSPISLPLLAISTFQLHCFVSPDNCLRSVAGCTPEYKFGITNNRILMSLFDQNWDPCSKLAYYKFICGTNIFVTSRQSRKITVRVIDRRNPPAVRYNADGLLRTPIADV